jgi:hypothetical protein
VGNKGSHPTYVKKKGPGTVARRPLRNS